MACFGVGMLKLNLVVSDLDEEPRRRPSNKSEPREFAPGTI
jgi:hypothetical protein